MKNKTETSIEDLFRNQVQKDPSVRSAHLLVHAEKAEVHGDLAEGSTGSVPANPQQPWYIASVGKLFTAVLVASLFEQGRLTFEDGIAEFLDDGLLENLHLYQGRDYTREIKVRHLLNHTSGLADHFYPLLEKLLEDPEFNSTPREIVEWSKTHLKPHASPGAKFHYSDTNYHLLGLIVESVTGMPFHQALREYIFAPVGMPHSYMHHYSEPMESSQYPMADFYNGDTRLTDYRGYAAIDYAGGGIVSTSEDLLAFMKALVTHQIISQDTFGKMQDWDKYGFGIDYGYGIMKFKTVPILMPKKFNSWGHAGATGAFMFYHPGMDAHLIGTFNQFTYERKSIRFMFKVINKLSGMIR